MKLDPENIREVFGVLGVLPGDRCFLDLADDFKDFLAEDPFGVFLGVFFFFLLLLLLLLLLFPAADAEVLREVGRGVLEGVASESKKELRLD